MKRKKNYPALVVYIITIILFFSSIAYAGDTTDTFTVTIRPVFGLLLYNESPVDEATNVNLPVTLSISCTSVAGDLMNLSWYWGYAAEECNNLFATNNSINNGTYYQTNLANFSLYDTTFYWLVNLTDINGNHISRLLSFTTARTFSITIIGAANNTTYAIIGIIGIFGLLGLFFERRKKKRKKEEM